MGEKLAWKGKVVSVQPRIRLLRSFDERSHGYLGCVLRIEGTIDEEEREFLVAIGKAAQAEHQLCPKKHAPEPPLRACFGIAASRRNTQIGEPEGLKYDSPGQRPG